MSTPLWGKNTLWSSYPSASMLNMVGKLFMKIILARILRGPLCDMQLASSPKLSAKQYLCIWPTHRNKQRLTATIFLIWIQLSALCGLDISTSYINFFNLPDENQILISSLMDVSDILWISHIILVRHEVWSGFVWTSISHTLHPWPYNGSCLLQTDTNTGRRLEPKANERIEMQ